MESRLGLSGVVLVSATVLSACAGTPGQQAEDVADAVHVVVGEVTRAEWPTFYDAGGVVRAGSTATLSSRVVAPVAAVHVSAGDRVRPGQVLVELDGRELGAQAARAAASAAGAKLALDAARAEQRAAEAALDLARATHERVRVLAERRSATPQELDQTGATLAAAEARAAAARARVAEAGAGVDATAAAEEAAAVGVSYTRIAAPFDGRVAHRHVDPGSLAAPGVALLTVEDTTAFRLEVAVDEARAHLVSAGQTAHIRLDRSGRSPGGWMPTTVTEVANLHPAQHTFLVKLAIPAAPDLRSGLFGRARFAGATRAVIQAPANAVVRRGQLAFAFVVAADGAARLRMVSAGDTWNDRIEIQSGLQPGDLVVVSPPAGLGDGTRVRREPASNPAGV